MTDKKIPVNSDNIQYDVNSSDKKFGIVIALSASLSALFMSVTNSSKIDEGVMAIGSDLGIQDPMTLTVSALAVFGAAALTSLTLVPILTYKAASKYSAYLDNRAYVVAPK